MEAADRRRHQEIGVAWAGLGAQLYAAQKYGEAIDALKKATELNPKAGPAFNMLGYAHLVQGEAGPAIEALKQYASANPDEPNPQDSLGEALMAGGQFAEAEAAFRKAVTLSPGVLRRVGRCGVHESIPGRLGGCQGGAKTGARRRVAAVRQVRGSEPGRGGHVRGRQGADGMKQLDMLEKSPDASAVDAAFVPISRARALVDASRYREAEVQIAKALQTADAGALPPGVTRSLRRNALALRAATEGRSGNAAAAEKTVAALQQDATARPDDAPLQSSVHFAQGMLAAARKDLKAAKGHFDLCSNQDELLPVAAGAFVRGRNYLKKPPS